MPEATPLGLAFGQKANGKPTDGKHEVALPRIWTASELITTDFPPPRWAVPGLIPQGLTYLVGAPKIGKSWMCLALGIAVAKGGRVLGQIPVEAGDVLYLALEDSEIRLKGRLVALNYETRDHDTFSLAREWKRLGEGGIKQLAQWLSGHPACRLVIIDTLAKIRKLNDNPRSVYMEEYQVGDYLKRLADQFGVAILVLHHIRKMAADDPLETVSGSFGLTGVADGALIIQRSRGQSDATLWVMGRDIAEERQVALRFDSATAQWTLMGDASAYQMSKERREIVRVLQDAGQSLTVRDVAGLVGKPQPQVKIMLWRMYQEGQVKNAGEGRYEAIARTVPGFSVTDESIASSNRCNRVTGVTVDTSVPVTPVTGVTRVTAVTQVTGAECLDCGQALQEGWSFRCPDCWAKYEEGLSAEPDGSISAS